MRPKVPAKFTPFLKVSFWLKIHKAVESSAALVGLLGFLSGCHMRIFDRQKRYRVSTSCRTQLSSKHPLCCLSAPQPGPTPLPNQQQSFKPGPRTQTRTCACCGMQDPLSETCHQCEHVCVCAHHKHHSRQRSDLAVRLNAQHAGGILQRSISQGIVTTCLPLLSFPAVGRLRRTVLLKSRR